MSRGIAPTIQPSACKLCVLPSSASLVLALPSMFFLLTYSCSTLILENTCSPVAPGLLIARRSASMPMPPVTGDAEERPLERRGSVPGIAALSGRRPAIDKQSRSDRWRARFGLPESEELVEGTTVLVLCGSSFLSGLSEWRCPSSRHAHKPGVLGASRNYLCFEPPYGEATVLKWEDVTSIRKVGAVHTPGGVAC
jgi:hypothetical protein